MSLVLNVWFEVVPLREHFRNVLISFLHSKTKQSQRPIQRRKSYMPNETLCLLSSNKIALRFKTFCAKSAQISEHFPLEIISFEKMYVILQYQKSTKNFQKHFKKSSKTSKNISKKSLQKTLDLFFFSSRVRKKHVELSNVFLF